MSDVVFYCLLLKKTSIRKSQHTHTRTMNRFRSGPFWNLLVAILILLYYRTKCEEKLFVTRNVLQTIQSKNQNKLMGPWLFEKIPGWLSSGGGTDLSCRRTSTLLYVASFRSTQGGSRSRSKSEAVERNAQTISISFSISLSLSRGEQSNNCHQTSWQK